MAYPTGTGSEILARTTIHNQSNSVSSFRWDGTNATVGTTSYTVPALHIITVLSVIIAEQGNAAETVDLYILSVDDAGSQNIVLLEQQPLDAFGTFVWNDKFVLRGGDKLYANLGSAGNVDFLCTYIDQNWED